MASTIPGVRFVRCPKCNRLLLEFANVPVYKCGECNTTLRAKNYNVNVQNTTVAPMENKSQSQPASGSLDNGLPSNNEMTVCASEDGAQNAPSSNPQSSYIHASNDSFKKGDALEHEQSCIKERVPDSQSLSPTNERNDTHTMMQNDLDNYLRGIADCSSNEVKKSSKLCQQGHERLKLSERIHDSASSEDNETNRSHHDRHGNISQSNTTSSNAYDGNDSSVNDGCNGDARRKQFPLSRRTFKQRKVQDSAETDAHKGEGAKEMTAGTQVQAQVVSQEPSEEKSALFDRFGSNANELSRENKDHVRQDTSLNSEDFHSVQNWMEPENDGPLKSLSRDAEFRKVSPNSQNGSPSPEFNSLEHIQMEILRKVDELREEINGIFDKPNEGKGRSQLRVIQEEKHTKHLDSNLVRLPPKSYWQRKEVPQQHRITGIPSGLPPIPRVHCHHKECQTSVKLPAQGCCCNGICRACHHNSPRAHMDSRLACQKPRIEHEPEKSYNKDKRQQMKRNCRPVLGGAPFVICYNCLELLKLPMDFFIARKRFYKLQCGACSKVLMYSFRGQNHGSPCMPNEVETPTSEVESSTGTTPRHEVSNFGLNDRSQWEPVSYSEEYGLSLGISYSTDIEQPVYIPRNTSSLMEKRNCKLRTGSQLHQLMGYGSASELLYQHSDIDEESEITQATTPHCNTPEETYVGHRINGKAIYISDSSTSGHF